MACVLDRCDQTNVRFSKYKPHAELTLIIKVWLIGLRVFLCWTQCWKSFDEWIWILNLCIVFFLRGENCKRFTKSLPVHLPVEARFTRIYRYFYCSVYSLYFRDVTSEIAARQRLICLIFRKLVNCGQTVPFHISFIWHRNIYTRVFHSETNFMTNQAFIEV